MNKKGYIFADVINTGLGGQLVTTATMIKWASMSNRSLILNWSPKQYHHISILDRIKLLSPKLNNNMFDYLFVFPKSVNGVDIYSINECKFLMKLEIIWKLITARLFSAISMRLIRLLVRLRIPVQRFKEYITSINTAKMSLEKLCQSKRVFLMPNCLLDRIELETKFNLSFKDPVILNPLFEHLKLTPKLEKRVNEFIQYNFTNKKVIGVHIRYFTPLWTGASSMSNHRSLWQNESETLLNLKNNIRKAFEQEDPKKTIIFLATGQHFIRDYMKKQFGTKLIYFAQYLGNKLDEFDQMAKYGVRTTKAEAAIEMFLLTRVDKLLFNSDSWFVLYSKSIVKDTVRI